MRFYIYPTDHDWFRFLRGRTHLDEVNFWQPGGGRVFTRLGPGELFLFRLKHPINKIAGGGVFVHASVLPIDLAWLAFGEKNGVGSLPALQAKIAKYKGYRSALELVPTDQIGCIILGSPFFWDEPDWLPVPADYSANLVQGKAYTTESVEAAGLYEQVLHRLGRSIPATTIREEVVTPGASSPSSQSFPSSPGAVWSEPVLAKRRLGQGSFRVLITDAYDRRCAITGERTLPVLEAAHIRPVSREGQHRIDNGLLFRSDIHTLFDRGYVTVSSDLRFRVSPRLNRDWSNGRVYYALDGESIRLPRHSGFAPAKEQLEWHADTVYLR